jgi:hypothetical protein
LALAYRRVSVGRHLGHSTLLLIGQQLRKLCIDLPKLGSNVLKGVRSSQVSTDGLSAQG